MKKRTALLPLLFVSISLLLGAALSSTKAIDDPPERNYLPLIAKDSGLLYWDYFGDPSSGWEIGAEYNDANEIIVTWDYKEGEYEIRIPQLDTNEIGRWAAAFAPVRGFHRYGVEADMRRSEGDVSEYGLIFDLKDVDNFYVFTVHPGRQTFAVIKRKLGVWTTVTNYRYAAAIKPDNETNHLRVDRNNDDIIVYANGVKLDTINDSGFIANPVPGAGLFTTMFRKVPAGVRYDNFEVWREGTGYSQPSGIRLTESGAAGGASSGSDVDWTEE